MKKTHFNIILLITCIAILCSCHSAKPITEANSQRPILKGKKHMLVPGNAYKIRKPKKA